MEYTEIWQKYEAGKDHHQRHGMYQSVKKCHRFYEGDQWHGMKAGGESLPTLNFIKPIARYQINMVAMNDMAMIFTSMVADPEVQALCEDLTHFAAAQAEKCKLDQKKWEIVKNACITGDHYLYVFDARQPSESVVQELSPQLVMRLVDKDDLYLANEEEPDFARQDWIIIAERLPVEEVKGRARAAKIPEDQIELIGPDEQTDAGDEPYKEMHSGEDKCTSLLHMRRTENGCAFCRSVKTVVYEPERTVKGLKTYPVCGMRWEAKHGSARGLGVVERLIPNQIEVNKTLARRSLIVKRYGYPTAIVDAKKVLNPEALATVGAIVKVDNLGANPVNSMVQYLQPAGPGGDAAALEAELLTQSRELEGAGEAATGQVDPTQASGEAIKAARDQSALNLNEQTANFKQFIEDLAQIWYQLWVAYATNGLLIRYTTEDDKQIEETIDQEQLQAADINIRIDVSPVDPYSVMSREMALENALAAKHITFEEYVKALDANSGVPKEKFQAIINARQQSAAVKTAQTTQNQAALPMEVPPVMDQTSSGQLSTDMLTALVSGGGGDVNALPVV